MAKWCVQIVFTGCTEVKVEADNYDEACDKAIEMANIGMVDCWGLDVDDCDEVEDWPTRSVLFVRPPTVAAAGF